MLKDFGAARVMRGWLAASLCTWTAFAAHAHSAPTRASLVVMVLITCVSAVIAIAMLGKKFSLLATSIVVLLSQGLYHLALSVMTHHAPAALPMAQQHAGHHHGVELAGNIASQYGAVQSDSMLYAHILAAVTSIVVLHTGEQLLAIIGGLLTLSTVRHILARARKLVPEFPQVPATFIEPVLNQISVLLRLPARRGPPSNVLPLFA
ncbi:hypothetical protein CQ010_09385 [Arthrobacter sp. MYb211]|nr:hypothetical protein CQ015_10755 [Arthrobacter sp. MYb221]PRC07486.1 hypothetical protein CQ010_09385 [Arthrobacter sp. MYb211]